ncbi:rod shape-determining protein MreC [Natranaerofaba carboxydovora]|uniref:rod shape-determining protein MreC n=1 Tax=Natranaerofaba carboxydovora TaxID=2742683 RepID=UPI001F147697|nr:rod shape-determining protein MreC [Natranaerofaba carboxydovora]UMZ72869.1 Cell shape-determining protein MreC [Natranaerofaba carboxydovora]
MFSPLIKYKKGIIVSIIAILLIALMGFTYQGQLELDYLDNIFSVVTVPVQDFISSINNNLNSFVMFLVNIRDLSQENQVLSEKLTEYENLELENKELKEENERLRELLDFQEREEHDLIPAKVVGRDPNTWNQLIVINKGEAHGIREEMPVVTDDGLVGRTTSVSRNRSQVLLLLDPGSALSSIVQRSRVSGITEGIGDNSGVLQLINLPKDEDVEIDDVIITSGQGPIFPKGLKIGEIKEIEEEALGFTKRAIIQPAVNFNKLEEVFIIEE